MSLSKSFTATAIVMLAEQEKLRLDDPICGFIAECPIKWRSIKLYHLLSHTSGLDDFTTLLPGESSRDNGFPNGDPRFKMPLTHEAAIRYFGRYDMLAPPGKEHSYSNSGFYLLGLVIEKVTGTEYETALRNLIFDPLEMHDTGAYPEEAVIERRAEGYKSEWVNGSLVLQHADYFHPSWFFATGALYSSIEDLAKFDRALFDGRLLSDTWRQKMWTPVFPSPEPPYHNYGLGWRLNSEPGIRSIGHNGAGPGGNSSYEHYLDDDVTIIELTNGGTTFYRLYPIFRTIIARGNAPFDTSVCTIKQ